MEKEKETPATKDCAHPCEENKVMFWYGMVSNGKNMVPVVTVASRYNDDDGTVSRGVAICSIHDNPSRKAGRELALKRLDIAEYRKLSSLPIKWDSDPIVASGAAFTEFSTWTMKSQYHVPIAKHEERVFLGPKSKHKRPE